ncbi:unnamed protein product [Adineta steineri]|uniref:Mono(ADP-ribosyl)transferase n=1 Tax=Adineta steineri TaxID=433720 RepID=A0A815K5H1_9BILA|nr:unnamed protein product [Adineta steineri]CAF1609001.1 unnamed protein product [Adineta steineri]
MLAMATGGDDEYFAQRVLRLTDIPKEPMDFLMPISGYEEMPIVSLEEAVETLVPILPAVKSFARAAKKQCKKPADNLTQDESASIMLYSMGWEPLDKCLYCALNATLRSKNRSNLKPWFLFLRLFLGALFRLPPIPHLTVFRGVKLDLSKQFEEDETFIWWGFSSCTTSIKVLQSEQFLGMEDEVLLLAATEFQVKGILDQGHGLRTIQLQEVQSDEPMLIPVPSTNDSVDLSAGKLKDLKVKDDITESKIISKQTATTSSASIPKPKVSASGNIVSQCEPKFNKWKQNAITVAGGNGEGHQLNQLNRPEGIFIDKKKNIFIADYYNQRIVEWKHNAKEGQTIAGGSGEGNGMGQSHWPTDVIVDQQNHSIIIADQGNGRVIQCINQNQQILINNISCWGLATDKHGFLYVSDRAKNEVRRWKMGEYNNEGIVVAGGNEKGNKLNQLNIPTFIFVDEDQSVYVSDQDNHRVMKWRKYAKEGTIVAGGNGCGENLNQFSLPQGVIVDDLGQIYVTDFANDRVMRWCEGKEEGEIIVGGNGGGNQSNQLSRPYGLSFDDEGNLYVADSRNHRIQKFEIIF